jgi:hypothetical protein
VDTVGVDADMIRKYVRYQEQKEKQLEQLQLIFIKTSYFGFLSLYSDPSQVRN